MTRNKMLLSLAGAFVMAATLTPVPAASAGGMQIPSSGSIGPTGLFLSCRTTSASNSTTEYYDQQNQLKVWDCGSGKRSHKGVDMSGSPQTGVTPVVAAAAGEVWTAERGNGFGWRVVLRHGHDVGGNGLHTYTIYGHMGDCATGESLIAAGIVPGAQVSAGQLLGYQGDDSFPNGCASTHLHWEVRVSTSDVSNVFLATPASPNFYTGVQLTADDPNPVSSVTGGTGAGEGPGVPTPPPPPTIVPTPTGAPTVPPTSSPPSSPPPTLSIPLPSIAPGGTLSATFNAFLEQIRSSLPTAPAPSDAPPPSGAPPTQTPTTPPPSDGPAPTPPPGAPLPTLPPGIELPISLEELLARLPNLGLGLRGENGQLPTPDPNAPPCPPELSAAPTPEPVTSPAPPTLVIDPCLLWDLSHAVAAASPPPDASGESGSFSTSQSQ